MKKGISHPCFCGSMDTILEGNPLGLFGPNMHSFHPACSEKEYFHQIFPIFQPIRSHGSHLVCRARPLDMILAGDGKSSLEP